MFDKPIDVDGECNAWLFIADNFGDSAATIRCYLPVGHEGKHCEQYTSSGGSVCIKWEVDASFVCPVHGRVERVHSHVTGESKCPVCLVSKY